MLNAAANIDSLAKLPTRKRDSLNTAEQVSISLAAAGDYQIKVTGTNIAGSAVPFNVAWHTDTLNTFYFTSPQHASDVNREEDPDLDIRWRTFVADTNQTGNLYISYDNGANWQLIKVSHKIYTNLYRWPIKDTNSTAELKMETAFGDFFSKRFIISKVIRPTVDFLCTDSFSLSWNKHVYATGYKIYTLADSPYLKQILTVADTFIVLRRSQYPSLIYAVEPILNNSLPAARSIAIGIKATSNILYHQLANDVPIGTSYWRVKIKLKNGAIVYTEIISVLTTGKRYILFYPNPTNRNSPLIYILQQGIPTDSRLQLFDISGRLVKSFSEMPDRINISTLASGMLVYKLYNSNKQLLETGKLIIQ